MPPHFPTGAGQAEVQAACAASPPAIVASKRYDADKWAEVVDQMIGKGAKVSDADYDVIVAYLARTYGVGSRGNARDSSLALPLLSALRHRFGQWV
jgi:hypothetical protein